MIPQLVRRLIGGTNPDAAPDPVKRQAALDVLTADPLDLILYMEQIWDLASAFEPGEFRGARFKMWQQGRFANDVGEVSTVFGPWDHFGYAYVLESTRMVQIFKRIVRGYRSGEKLGVPSKATQQWLDATEALLFGAANPLSAWLSTSTVRQEPEAVRRNAYWRMFGLDLGFGADDNSAAVFDKAEAANTSFTSLFEELLFELWQAISNQRNLAGINQADNDRIARIAEELRYILTSRRQDDLLWREELSAVTALGWGELTVSFNTPIVQDLGAEGSSPGDRLRLMGERVGLPAHSRSAAFFSMSAEISKLLRVLEAGIVKNADTAWVLYASTSTATSLPPEDRPVPIGAETRRVITEWAAATGKNLKERSKPIDVRAQAPRLVAVR